MAGIQLRKITPRSDSPNDEGMKRYYDNAAYQDFNLDGPSRDVNVKEVRLLLY